MPKTKFDPDKEIPSLAGKVILVTGGNEGIGKATVLQLAKHQPAKIFLSARSQEKADKAIADIKAQAGASISPIEYLQLDQSSFESIKHATDDLAKRTDRLDIVVANAGVLGTSSVTQEGYEWSFGVNHVGTSLLIRRLLPLLQKTSKLPDAKPNETRVVILASEAEKFAPQPYPFDKIKTDLKNQSTLVRYGHSKLANAHYAAQLAKHFPEAVSGVKFVAVHPGKVQSNMGNEQLAEFPSFTRTPVRKLTNILLGLVPASEGAWNQLWAAAATNDSSKLGEPKEGVLYWPVGVENKATSKAYDMKSAAALWDWTEAELSGHI